jgi:hypothetical protein
MEPTGVRPGDGGRYLGVEGDKEPQWSRPEVRPIKPVQCYLEPGAEVLQ